VPNLCAQIIGHFISRDELSLLRGYHKIRKKASLFPKDPNRSLHGEKPPAGFYLRFLPLPNPLLIPVLLTGN
jgi:hypothetical protein